MSELIPKSAPMMHDIIRVEAGGKLGRATGAAADDESESEPVEAAPPDVKAVAKNVKSD